MLSAVLGRSMPKRSPSARAGIMAAIASLALTTGGCDQLQRETFTPEVGQAGKDVIWVPTPDALVTKMLEMAQVTEKDVVVDLGSGDGKIAIAAARDFGATARGVEFNPDMVALSRRNAEAAGIDDKATFQEGDIFATDFTDATVVTMYLLPSLNVKLRPTLLNMKPGVRIVSHAFDMGEWVPDGTTQAEGATAYLWIVPAKAEGAWRFDLGEGATLDAGFAQSFQQLTPANVALSGKPASLSDIVLRGEALSFVVDGAPAIAVAGVVQDGRFTGSATPAGGAARPATGVLTPPAGP